MEEIHRALAHDIQPAHECKRVEELKQESQVVHFQKEKKLCNNHMQGKTSLSKEYKKLRIEPGEGLAKLDRGQVKVNPHV